ncbi:alpha/beta hydrolase [Mucilaginibacter hurinus]|uniref:Alpha/beta hydrolase n=1 Tax=Mucilaginibacter hurinus TaxID=2201324 RepID=A0A367GSI1_9SPHI|nr:alpha/beta hydrolase [Mucilaginibacter hurinus]RCH55786.1 alpha/beta hydrolase [Mucilaginibacter hurinus]
MFLFVLLISSFSAGAQQLQYVTEKNIRYHETSGSADAYRDAQCTIDLYYPQGAKNYATIVWFHGGGITGGAKEIPKELLNKGYAIAGVGYRLSPKVKAPVYIEDAAAAVAWVFKHIAKYGGSDKLIFVSGHSAGGYLGTMITLDKSYLDKHHIDANRIAGLIPFSGQAITHFTIRNENGLKPLQPTIDKYSPLYFVRQDAPPILLITGDREKELFGRYEENAYMARMFKLAGHTRTKLYELQGFDHGEMAQPAFPLLLKEVAEIRKEIESAK